MRVYHLAGGLAALLLSACTAEQSEAESNVTKQVELAPTPNVDQLVNSLVDSFDVATCIDAQLRFAGRINSDGSVFHQRRFEASDECLRDLKASAVRLGFKQGKSGELSGSIVDGVAEQLSFDLNEDLKPGNLLWEVDVT